jgi:predicted aldo/keto reductase-like oxidoreductase
MAEKQQIASQTKGWATLVAWIATCILGYAGPGIYIAEMVEGIDRSMMPLYPSILFGVALLISLVMTVWWAMSIQPKATNDEPTATQGLGRRRFLLGGAALTGGVAGAAVATVSKFSGWMTVTSPALREPTALIDPNPKDEWQGSRIKSYRKFGSTGFEISDICIGAGQITRHPDPVRFLQSALDRGVNYIDTSPDYAGTKSEIAIGKAIQGRRDDLFIATKWCTSDGHVRQGSSVETYVKSIEDSLKRLNSDYVDLVHVHSCDSVGRLLDPNVHEAFDRMKQQGKVRFMGVSTHTPNLEEVARAAIDSERFDVMMLAYHHGAWPNQQAIIDDAAAKGIGVVAMKTLKGAKHRGLADFRPEADSYCQAAFKWVLANPSVSSLVISFYENQHIDEYLYASGGKLTDQDLAILEKYDSLIAGTHCFAHCGDCLGACPEKIAINDVLRHRMYFEDYGDQKQAMQLYAKLDKRADICITCSAPCTGACPASVPIQERMLGAHELLTLA